MPAVDLGVRLVFCGFVFVMAEFVMAAIGSWDEFGEVFGRDIISEHEGADACGIGPKR